MGSDENGMPITAFKSLSGGYHLEGEKAGLTIYTFNLLSCFGPNDDIGLIRSSAELSIDNSVHLTAAAYGDMAAVISGRTDAIVDQQAGGATRRRLASVIASASPAERRIRESRMDQRSNAASWRPERWAAWRPAARQRPEIVEGATPSLPILNTEK